MSIYYFENENGTFFSEDGKRRFIRLSGKEAYDYMRENKSGDSYFVQTVTDDTEDGDGTAVVDKYSDDGHTVEDAVIREINLEILRRALKALTDDELKIVRSLYLDDNPMSERQLSKELGVSQKTVNNWKRRVLDKLKKYF